MNKIKVGIFNDSFYPMLDGVITAIDNYATLLLDKNCEVTVFTVGSCKGKKDTKDHPYKVVKSKTMRLFFLDYDLPTPNRDKKFKKLLEESDLDIVYFHSPMGLGKTAIKYAKAHNIPIISHLHSQFYSDFYRATRSKLISDALLRKIIKVFNNSDCAIAVNDFTKDLFRNNYKLKSPVKVVNNATNMTPVDNIEEAKRFINEKYGFNPDRKIFTYVGRITKLKNIDTTLNALAILKKKYDNFTFLVVGGGKDMSYFEQRVKKLGLTDNVIFAGKIHDQDLLKKVYARADLLLFPSLYDTDGIIKFEAASQYTPTVFVENTGAASQIIDNETGFISARTPEAFAEKIYEAITNDSLYEKVSKNCYEKVYRTWQDSANEVYNLMLELIEKKKSEKKENN